jgi:hypothetical protein
MMKNIRKSTEKKKFDMAVQNRATRTSAILLSRELQERKGAGISNKALNGSHEKDGTATQHAMSGGLYQLNDCLSGWPIGIGQSRSGHYPQNSYARFNHAVGVSCLLGNVTRMNPNA